MDKKLINAGMDKVSCMPGISEPQKERNSDCKEKKMLDDLYKCLNMI